MSTGATLQVAILDMQPIDPPTGGGRLRLLGLYHRLGPNIRAHYVGTYDWPGPEYRQQNLSDNLRETLVPLSAAHFAAADRQAAELGGRGVIDLTFHRLAELSPAYVAAARDAAASADVVVFSHPWIYPLVLDVLDRARQVVVYDAHNVEGLLRAALLDDGGPGTQVVRDVVAVEAELCRTADLILSCSHPDRDAFRRIYDISAEKIRIAPNGSFTDAIRPLESAARATLRTQFNVQDRPVALFLGTNYGPNVDAARFISQTLAPALPGIEFVLVGSVGDAVPPRASVRVTGLVSETEKRAWLQLADIAINPMFGGSGTNIKMLEYMSAGLPVVTTSIGARGIETGSQAFVVAEGDRFVAELSALVDDAERRGSLGSVARTEAERHYSWERISTQVGRMLTRRARRHGRRPFFSVVVPTYARHEHLARLAKLLETQLCDDFELIVVDQTPAPWPERDRPEGLDLCYIHTDVRGAVAARNTGAAVATGTVIAFTDDDCEPGPNWLAAARREFETSEIAGLEGLILSDRLDDPDWRPVTNAGFEGFGFMTANLFVRASVFHQLGGFDLRFDNPHFREDTDLGWRIQQLGRIPFSREAWVYHPPQPRSLERESLAERSRFFEKDALLLRKHPGKYCELFERECQWKRNPHFWDNFLRGVQQWNVDVPPSIRASIPTRAACTMALESQERQ
jgi:glycosyltransferase involved in cell wall biosynthesis